MTVHSADDEADYFDAEITAWMSAEERAEVLRRREERRRAKEEAKSQKYKFTIDFSGRTVLPAAPMEPHGMAVCPGPNKVKLNVRRALATAVSLAAHVR